MRSERSRKDASRYVENPTFTMIEQARGWRVQITWSDGEEGPAIAFATKADAELWIKRDAGDWLLRLAAVSPPRD